MINSCKELEALIYDMFAHKCSGTITSYENPKRLTFGWKCSCGKTWILKLFQVQRFMGQSIFKEDIRTPKKRNDLIWSRNGYPVIRNEEIVLEQK